MKRATTTITLVVLGLTMLFLASCDTRVPTEKNQIIVNYNINLSADRYTIYADNGKTVAELTATVTNEDSEPLSGVTVVFSALKGAVASNVTTSSSGQATATFDDKGQVSMDPVQIVARYTDENDNTVRDTVYVEILPLEALVHNFFARTDPTSGQIVIENEDSTYTGEIIAQVRDSSGVAVKDVKVNYRILEGMEVGFLDLAFDSTDGAGATTSNFQNTPGSYGHVEVEAFIEAQSIESTLLKNPGLYDFGSLLKGASASDVVFADTVGLDFIPFQAYTVQVFSLDPQVYADNGETIARIRAVVKDGNNQPPDSIGVYFSTDLGTISSPAGTNTSGVAETEYSDLGSGVSFDTVATVYAAISHQFFGTVIDSTTITILVDNTEPERIPDRIDLQTEYEVLPPYDNENVVRSTLTATVVDSNGYPVNPNTIVTFETDIGVVEPAKTTDENGVAQAMYTMGDSAGIARIYAYSGEASDSVFITVRPSEPAYLVIPPSSPNRIVVAGGWGAESTTIRAEVRDSRGELVDTPVEVEFVLGPNFPSGANLNGVGTMATDTTNYGIASVTLNSGVQSGPVRVTATVLWDGATIQSTAVPVTIAAGPPAFAEVDIDVNGIIPIGGGMYEAELAARYWDAFTNPVEDSTQVYWYIQPDSIASIVGDSFTGNENRNGDHYPGIAWNYLYYNSDETFNNIQVLALTWGAEGDSIIGVLNDTENDSLLITFFPGNLTVIPELQFYDFQPANNPNPDPVGILLTAILVDYYNNPIKNARILFTAIGAAGFDPVDAMGLPIIRTNDQGVSQITAFFSSALCTPNFDADGDVTSYNPFTAYVGAILVDPQSIASEQVAIEFRRSIQTAP